LPTSRKTTGFGHQPITRGDVAAADQTFSPTRERPDTVSCTFEGLHRHLLSASR
jgi:hypothetical protein